MTNEDTELPGRSGSALERPVVRPVEDETDAEGPRGTYGCACVSRDARECMERRHPELTLGPQPDDMDEYSYMHAERCQCLCHDWSDDDDCH